jgi:hypothetical protein
MNRANLFALTFGMLAVGTGGAAFATTDQSATQCSLSSLDGNYVYSTQGTLDGEPYTSAGIMSFDGEGNVAILATRSVEREQITEVADGTINNLYLDPVGKIFKFVRVTGEGAVGGEAERVTTGFVGQLPGQ